MHLSHSPQSEYFSHKRGKVKGKVHPRTGHKGPEGEKRYSSTPSLSLALDGGGWVVNATPRLLYHRERLRTHCISSWRGAENLAPNRIRSLDRPACSESLYQLRYTGPPISLVHELLNSAETGG